MAYQDESELIEGNPIGNGLDRFIAFFTSTCRESNISPSADALSQLGQQELKNLARRLLATLNALPIVFLLRSHSGETDLSSDITNLLIAFNSDWDEFDIDPIKPLLRSALADHVDDALIWDQVYRVVAECTPPPWDTSSLQQTPWLRNTSSFANTSEHCKYVYRVLKQELGPLHVGLCDFCKTFFGRVVGLEAASEAVFDKCVQGSSPLFNQGWSGWPRDANQDGVLSWFADLIEKLVAFADEYKSTPTRRRSLAQLNKPIQGFTEERKMDIGFVNDPDAGRGSRCSWSQILVPGELKSNPSADTDTTSKAWLDLGSYARGVLAVQDTRRFVLGFTICGSLMRVWEFDRLGGIASEQFDINHDGLQFVSTVLGFLWMNEEQLGFDPTITTEHGQRFVTVERNGQTEVLVIDKLIKRAPRIAGRATTCWKAHRKEDPKTPLVIKDSWQFTERGEEGDLLRAATEKGVVNVARYYHHETVFVHGEVDDVRGNIRGGLDITKARNYRPEPSGRSSAAGVKRSSSQTNAPLPPSISALANRVHRRVILSDYGTPIYKASSPSALLAALQGCIEGHESLHAAGLLHRDISINNLMINEDPDNPSWPGFLIDLDLAIQEQRLLASGEHGKTGTRAFMAVGALLGEQHSFMHDLESFFWVLFWICIHFEGPGKGRAVPKYDKWNYMDMDELATSKTGTISVERIFLIVVNRNFTSYYQPLIPWINRLRRTVFPNGRPWEKPNPKLYSLMTGILREAQEPNAL